MVSTNTTITSTAAITGEVARAAADGATLVKGFYAKSYPHPLHQNHTGGGVTESTGRATNSHLYS